MDMAIMQITVIPVGTASTSVGGHVADIEQYLLEKGVDHSLHDMGTIIAGPTGELFRLAEEIHSLPFRHGAQRVVTSITIDERTDKKRGIGDKVRAVKERLEKRAEK
ncbi:MAG: MTH1187 family thiamine-binding protein [Desulfobulbaceae bacterium]